MATLKKKLDNNVPGNFYVDSTCIDCDTCRQIAPETFKDDGDYSVVYHQPKTKEEERNAIRALLACPTVSIGTVNKNAAKDVMTDFPLKIDENIFYLGFNSPDSFGANAYFIKHPKGNWMIDSPKFNGHLIKKIDSMGGLKYIFLTHKDDVADSDQYAKKFGAKIIIHKDDAKKVEADILLEGLETVTLESDFVILPVPGHTKGSCVLLYKDKYLFTGDHLSWDRYQHHLKAFRRACWYSWEEQILSMDRLSTYSFEWVLTGHGQRVHLPFLQMKAEMHSLVKRMKEL